MPANFLGASWAIRFAFDDYLEWWTGQAGWYGLTSRNKGSGLVSCSFGNKQDTQRLQLTFQSIEDGTVLAGELPRKKHKLVVAWIEIHHEELMADWQLAVTGTKPFPIKGLDQ